MEDLILKTKRLAEANGLKFKDCGNGHVQISGHGDLVNYWPESKRRRAHKKGSSMAVTDCSPWDAVKLCLTKTKDADSNILKPKKVTKNEPQVQLGGIKKNPAGIRNFYTGKRPPWEFESFIICQSDQLRINARVLLDEAARMEG